MGNGASMQAQNALNSEAAKPLDARDVTNLEYPKIELINAKYLINPSNLLVSIPIVESIVIRDAIKNTKIKKKLIKNFFIISFYFLYPLL